MKEMKFILCILIFIFCFAWLTYIHFRHPYRYSSRITYLFRDMFFPVTAGGLLIDSLQKDKMIQFFIFLICSVWIVVRLIRIQPPHIFDVFQAAWLPVSVCIISLYFFERFPSLISNTFLSNLPGK